MFEFAHGRLDRLAQQGQGFDRLAKSFPSLLQTILHQRVGIGAAGAVVDFGRERGWRRLTYMMLDADVVACSPSSVCRVLKKAGMLGGTLPVPSKKGTGFVQPLAPHEHWHVDISYLNIAGTFYFLCTVLDGCSRFVVHDPQSNGK